MNDNVIFVSRISAGLVNTDILNTLKCALSRVPNQTFVAYFVGVIYALRIPSKCEIHLVSVIRLVSYVFMHT